jgi:glycerol-3-phosphate acyltransferase PlsY
MTVNFTLIVLIPVAYLLGSIPFGLVVGLAKGIDPRKSGSGNIGATNVGRLLGGKFFAIVFALDLLKGFLPTFLAAIILHNQPRSQVQYVLWLLIGFAAIAGHMFSIFLSFKGGKGVATGCGVALGVFPYYTVPVLIAVFAFLIVFSFSKIVSLSSIAGSIVLPIAYVLIGLLMKWDIAGEQLPLLVFVVLLSALIIFRHRGNIARLRAGTENRFVKSK